jgi:hypothetical protein
MATTTTTEKILVAVYVAYTLPDGRKASGTVLVPADDDALAGRAVVGMRAAKAAAERVRRRSNGTVWTRVLAAVPEDSLWSGPVEIMGEPEPMIGAPGAMTEHRFTES